MQEKKRLTFCKISMTLFNITDIVDNSFSCFWQKRHTLGHRGPADLVSFVNLLVLRVARWRPRSLTRDKKMMKI